MDKIVSKVIAKHESGGIILRLSKRQEFDMKNFEILLDDFENWIFATFRKKEFYISAKKLKGKCIEIELEQDSCPHNEDGMIGKYKKSKISICKAGLVDTFGEIPKKLYFQKLK